MDLQIGMQMRKWISYPKSIISTQTVLNWIKIGQAQLVEMVNKGFQIRCTQVLPEVTKYMTPNRKMNRLIENKWSTRNIELEETDNPNRFHQLDMLFKAELERAWAIDYKEFN